MRNVLIALAAAWPAVTPLTAQNISKIKDSARSAAASLQVTTENGKTTVTYKGKAVWSGKAKGQVTARTKTLDGKEYAVALDGQKVIWENIKGAAKKLQ